MEQIPRSIERISSSFEDMFDRIWKILGVT